MTSLTPDSLAAVCIIAAALVGGTIGFCGAALLSARRCNHIARQSWKQASIYYRELHKQQQ